MPRSKFSNRSREVIDAGSHPETQKSGPGVFRRLGHLHHYSLAAGELRLRGDRHGRRHRPGRRYDRGRSQGQSQRRSKVFVEDLREQFVTEFLWKLVRSGAVYEHKYLLGTSIARPLLARRQAEIALQEGARWRWPTAAPAKGTTRFALN